MDDTQLLHDYVHAGNEKAFSQLVSRHIDLVYGAARRLTRDPHTAEDVTQAVFIILAKKASRVHSGAVLPAWLLSATRYASINAITMAARRRKHEKAAAMNTISSPADDPSDIVVDDESGMSGALDAALARLGTTDRSAVAMRYLQGKSIRDIAAAMSISPEAAQKRVLRALAKLRDYFARRGIVLDGMDLDASLSRQVRHAAPAALAPLIAAKALGAKSLGASATAGAANVIADVVLRTFTWITAAKVAACGVAIAAVGIATAAAVQSNRTAPRPASRGQTFAAPAATAPTTVATFKPLPPPKPYVARVLSAESIWQPYVPSLSPGKDVIQIKNDSLKPTTRNSEYFRGFDPDTLRTKDSDPAVMISAQSPDATGGAVRRLFDAAPYRGKRVRLSGYVKSKDVALASGFTLWAFRSDGAALAQDDLGGRWVFGTNDWVRHDIVADISEQAEGISIYPYLRGPGTVWVDALELAVVDDSVPITDCHRWRGWTQTPAKYTATLDRKVLLHGQPTICMTCEKATWKEWMTYDHTELDVRPFLGKKLKVTAMIKCENLDWAGPIIRGVGIKNTSIQHDAFYGKRPVRGTLGWAKYSTTMTLPKDAADMSWGVTLSGGGTIWFGDLLLEIVE